MESLEERLGVSSEDIEAINKIESLEEYKKYRKTATSEQLFVIQSCTEQAVTVRARLLGFVSEAVSELPKEERIAKGLELLQILFSFLEDMWEENAIKIDSVSKEIEAKMELEAVRETGIVGGNCLKHDRGRLDARCNCN